MFRLTLLALFLAGSALAAAPDNTGFIYATVTWPDGEKKTGFLRWEDEEAFWDDLFHSGQRDLPWLQYGDMESLKAEKRNKYFQKSGLLDRVIYALTEDRNDPVDWRIFLVRMGDIRSIEIHKGKDDFVITADGSRHEVGGYANDAGSDLILYTGSGETDMIEWNDLATIEFQQAPADLEPYARRLYGTLETAEGTFTGFIQWDKTECLSIDILDGDDPEGQAHDLAMGELKQVRRVDRSSCEVTLLDGSVLTLSGTNDVNSGNRGIMVETDDLGRITVPWNRFIQLDFHQTDLSGHGRDAFNGAPPLTGTVTSTSGTAVAGRLVLDLDKAFAWNLFSGTSRDLDYDIPLPLIASLAPKDGDVCAVELRDGRTLDLSGSNETGEDNAGILVFRRGDEDPLYIPWSQVQRIDLDGNP